MLSIFPSLLTYELIAPFILRVVLGALFINISILKIGAERERWSVFFNGFKMRPAIVFVWILATIEFVGGVFLVFGFLTQLVALIFTILTFAELSIEFKEEVLLKRNIIFYLLVFVISLSLLFTGPGFFAIDLPL